MLPPLAEPSPTESPDAPEPVETATTEPSPDPSGLPSPTESLAPPAPTETVTETVTETPAPAPTAPSCGQSSEEPCFVSPVDDFAVPLWLGLGLVLLLLAAVLTAQLRRPR